MEVLVKHATLNVPHCIFELIKNKYYVFLGTADVINLNTQGNTNIARNKKSSRGM